jgi:hypothetical protein
MLALEIPIEAADLLPLHDREDRIQGVEVRNLDVRGVDVFGAAADEGDALTRMIPFLRSLTSRSVRTPMPTRSEAVST